MEGKWLVFSQIPCIMSILYMDFVFCTATTSVAVPLSFDGVDRVTTVVKPTPWNQPQQHFSYILIVRIYGCVFNETILIIVQRSVNAGGEDAKFGGGVARGERVPFLWGVARTYPICVTARLLQPVIRILFMSPIH